MTNPTADDWKAGPAPEPLRPQRGGTPELSALLYRDRLVDRLVGHLTNGENIVLTAEKRVGKTATMRLLEARANDDLLITYRDIESVGSPTRLVELVLEDLLPLIGGVDRAKKRLGDLCRRFAGTQVGSFSLGPFEPKDWQVQLNELFDAVAEHLADEGKTLAVLWDEAPWMIDKVKRDCGWQVAADLLDELRAARGRHPDIRFLFTGSVGFHHVLRDLRDGASHRAAINDMRQEELPPLAPADAGRLAWALLLWNGERGVELGDQAADLAEHVAEVCEGIPWFIHAAVDDLRQTDEPLTTHHVDLLVARALDAPNDPWGLRHWLLRLPQYYEDDAELVGLVLDSVAVRGVATPDQIVADLAHHQPVGRAEVLRLLRLVHEDHYLDHTAPTWQFAYRLVRRSWLHQRDLTPDDSDTT